MLTHREKEEGREFIYDSREEDEEKKWDSCFLWGYMTGVLFSFITYCLVMAALRLMS